MPFAIVCSDITKMDVDAIVNTANTMLHMDSVCDSIFYAAGIDKLQAACAKMPPVEVGDATITPGFDLPARVIIHTATPVFKDGEHGEPELLEECYDSSLDLAVENKCKSIAFPLLSSGIYGFPQKEVLRIATAVIRDFLTMHEMDVFLVVPDKTSLSIGMQLINSVESFLEEHYEGLDDSGTPLLQYLSEPFSEGISPDLTDNSDEQPIIPSQIFYQSHPDLPDNLDEPPAVFYQYEKIPNLSDNLDEPFSQTLLRFIDAKGKSDVDVYKRANIDRRLFSKIRGGKGYTPGKRTIIALAIALELTLHETEDLLKRAGYALSRSQMSDVIIEYFITKKKYDIFEINEVLLYYDQQMLGG